MWISPSFSKNDNLENTTINYKIGDKDERPWGKWEVIDVGSAHIVKKITIKPGNSSSLQKHSGRNEHWIIISGIADIVIGKEKTTLTPNQTAFIPIGTVHRIGNSGNIDLVKIEIQTGHLLDENDIIRLKDKYGRS